MKSDNSHKFSKRIFIKSILLTVMTIPVIYIFTKDPLYCIIFVSGTVISLSGFLIMIKVVDKLLTKKTGKLFFFSVTFVKLGLITVISIIIARYREFGFIFYIIGLSVVVFAVIIEGVVQLYRSMRYGA